MTLEANLPSYYNNFNLMSGDLGVLNNMNIQKITIKNFRCFEEKPIDFHVPDEFNKGSGLNIFIGENATGKTAVITNPNWLEPILLCV